MSGKTLRKQLEWATDKAKEVFELDGYHSHMLLGFKDDTVIVTQLHFKDDIEKRTELAYVKDIFKKEAVQSYIFIAEAWSAECKKGEVPKAGDAVNNPNRKEILSLLAVSLKETIACSMEIFRDGDKVWLGEPVYEDSGEYRGLLTELLNEEPKIYS